MGRRVLLLLFAVSCFTALAAHASTPSNDSAAFHRFDLYGERSAAVGVLDHRSIAAYPAELIDDALLVTRTSGSTDTVGLFRSQPDDHLYFEVRANQPASYVSYTLSPPLLASSLGLLAMGVNVYGPAGTNDYGRPLARVTLTHEDGDTTVAVLTVGEHLRNYWAPGTTYCGAPYYTLPPTDPLAGSVWQGSGYFYDVQELRLPADKRAKRISQIRVESLQIHHICGITWSDAGLRLFGFSIWPNFEVRNAQGQPVVRQSQATNRPHGGYLFGSQPVGPRRETNKAACQVASMAMCYTYAGFPCTVDSLNTHLQRTKGYLPADVCIVTWVSPTGDTIRYRPYTEDDTRLKVGDRFLVERGNYVNPLATFLVTDTTLRRAVLVPPRHNPTTPVVEGDRGRVYWNMIPRRADTYTQNPRLVSKQVGSSPGLGALVESLLVRNIPVQLNLKKSGHFVVADGWTPSFRPDGSARGTYSIKDPYEERNFTRLIESRLIAGTLADYRNQFCLACWVEPAPGPEPPGAAAVAGTSVPSLSVLTNGTWRVELVDPLGRRLLRDAGTDEDIAEIPNAWVIEVGSEHDDGDDWDDRQTGYDLGVAEALDGHYLLRVHADAGHAVNVSAHDDAGVFSTGAAGDTAVVPAGAAYDLHYSPTARTVAVSYVGPVGVEPPTGPAHRTGLAVRRNPATGPVEFVLAAPVDAADAIDVFDPGGRRVGVVRVAPGDRVVRWDWLQGRHRAGVYLARLRSGSAAVRFVILR